MIDFNDDKVAIVIDSSNLNSFINWAIANNISFQKVETQDEAEGIASWLPSEEEWNSSGCEWESCEYL